MQAGRFVITVVTAAMVLGPAGLASGNHGGPGGWVDVDEDDSEVDVGAVDEIVLPGGEGGGAGDDCRWSRIPTPVVEEMWWELDPTRTGGLVDPEDYDWFLVRCPDGSGGETVELVPVPTGPGPRPNPRVLRDEAIDRLALPRPEIAMNPAGDQVVHVETWLWIDGAIWRTHSKSVSAGGVTTTVTAAPPTCHLGPRQRRHGGV